MKSTDYLKEIMDAYYLKPEDLADIIDYLRYIARDNGEYSADSFLDDVEDLLEV